MKTQTLVCGSILAAAIIVAVLCVGMVTGFPGINPFVSADPVSHTNTGSQSGITGDTAAPVTVKAPEKPAAGQPTPVTGSSDGVIQLDPLGDNYGDYVITGTTSLPFGTGLVLQLRPDTGTPQTGIDEDSQMAIGGNSLVTKGDGTANRISQTVYRNELIPGKYVAIVGKAKREMSQGSPFEIGNDYGYTCFTLK